MVVALLAGLDVLHGRMSLGGVTACILILQQVYAPLFTLGFNYREIRQSFIDMEQMLELMAVQPEIVDAPDARVPAAGFRAGRRAGVRACRASGTPPARWAWSDVSFRHSARHDHRAGRSVRRGQDHHRAPGAAAASIRRQAACCSTAWTCAKANQASLRRAVALVPQDVALFNDTLCANIAFADPEAGEADGLGGGGGGRAWRASSRPCRNKLETRSASGA